MRTTAVFFCLSMTATLAAQDTITLFECHRRATENAPRLADRGFIQQIADLRVKQAGSGWYPTLDLNGKLSYQSDVVTVSLLDPTLPVAFPEVPHDQYGLNLDIKQTLYDGGVTRKKKDYEQAMAAAELQQVEVDLYRLKARVNQYYFAILVLQENRKNLGIHMDNLVARQETMKSAVEQGVQLEAELKVIDVEILRVKQSMAEVDFQKLSYINALNVLCGTEFKQGDQLETPDFEEFSSEPVNRPEYRLFELKDASMEAGKELTGKKRMPVLYAYGQTGYGKPGYNLMNSEWDFYYMVGAGLRWNIWDWNSTSRERQVIENQQQILRNQRAAFDREIESQLVQEEAKIDQYMKAMELEEQVLELQKEISRTAATKLSNGTITATDYITELNKESLARISLATHGILLAQSITNCLTIQGNL
jgi:outer membrane protein TolC